MIGCSDEVARVARPSVVGRLGLGVLGSKKRSAAGPARTALFAWMTPAYTPYFGSKVTGLYRSSQSFLRGNRDRAYASFGTVKTGCHPTPCKEMQTKSLTGARRCRSLSETLRFTQKWARRETLHSSEVILMSTVRAPNAYRLLWAGFFAIFASGVGFSVRTRVLALWAADYGFTLTELGEITGGGLTGFGVVILLGSLIADRFGYGKLMIFALIMHLLSAILQLCTDPIYQAFGRDGVYWSLYIAMFMFAIGNGICEAVVNPVVATLFPDRKTHYLNILHAGWPGGLIVGGLLAYFMNGGGVGDWVPLGRVHWLWQMSMFLIPVAIYGLMILGQSFPQSEAGQAGVGYGTMLLQLLSPLFILLLIIHAMVGYVELGTDSWIGTITGKIMASANYGLLLFIYTSGLMFILRFFGGPIEHRLSPLGLLCCSGIFGCLGLTLLSWVPADTEYSILMCVGAATVYALGKTFLWPTMLAVGSERFPRGGAITIGALGGAGMLSAGLLGGPGIGFDQDLYASRELKTKNESSYERYQAKEENTFLGLFHVRGLDGSKKNLLKKSFDLEAAKTAFANPSTPVGNKEDLARDIKLTEKEIETAEANNKALATWWKDAGEPNRVEDMPPVEQAELFGGRMALRITAAVPATMAVLYLLLILYFRMRGGYTKEVVLTTAAPGSEF
jgi:MFS family permease